MLKKQMALLVEVTFFDQVTNEVKKKKIAAILDHFSSYDADRILDDLKDEVLEEEFPGYGNYDE